MDDPLGYEAAGYALFDMSPERRGNLYSDEVYRLVKARDATTSFRKSASETSEQKADRYLPPNHKFSANDVILLTLQPQGSGDFFGVASLPTSGISVEARVLNSGPTYIDVAVAGGAFEAAFGPAPNNSGPSGNGDRRMRLRADRFFSNIPYKRMVSAISQLTAIPDRPQKNSAPANTEDDNNAHDRICMDELLRETILSTHAFSDPFSSYHLDQEFCDLRYLVSFPGVNGFFVLRSMTQSFPYPFMRQSTSLSKPPMATSQHLAKKALSYIQSNPHQVFDEFNEPQLRAIHAALTRRLTCVHGM
jgi:hypothetical protein